MADQPTRPSLRERLAAWTTRTSNAVGGAAGGAPPAAAGGAAPPGDLPNYRTGNDARGGAFRQTPHPAGPPREVPMAPRVKAPTFIRAGGPLVAAALEVPNAYNEIREHGQPWRAVGRSGLRLGGTAAAGALGTAAAGALGIPSGPGAVVAAGAGNIAGNYAGYKAGDAAADWLLPYDEKPAAGGDTEPGSNIAPPGVQRMDPINVKYTPPTLEERFNKMIPGYKGNIAAQQVGEGISDADIANSRMDAGVRPDAVQMRARTQGAVIENPHAMSDLDRLTMMSKSLKGSPSMREAAAKMIMGEREAKDANRQAELDANMAADAAVTKMNSDNRRAFADNQLKAQAANAELMLGARGLNAENQRANATNALAASTSNATLAEEGRQKDQQALVDLIESENGALRGAFGRGAGGRSGKEPYSFSQEMYDDLVPVVGAEAAAALASNAADYAREPDITSRDHYTQTRDQMNIANGVRRAGGRFFTGGDRRFDPRTAKPVDSTFWERTWNPGDPRGASRLWDADSPDADIRFEDANGIRVWGDANSLPEAPEVYRFRQGLRSQRSAYSNRE